MKRIYYIFSLILLISSCHTGRQYFPQSVPPADVSVVRFDKAILNLETVSDSLTMRAAVEELYQEYPDFAPVWVEEILGIPAEDTAYLCQILPLFLHDATYGFQSTNAKCAEDFADIRDLQKELNGAFGRLQTFYPSPLPIVYFFISGFNSAILPVFDDDIAIGIDMYLGSDYEYYNRVVYEYQKQTMRKECIPGDVVSLYLFNHVPFNSDKNRLLEQMIYRGKIKYLVSLLLPDEDPWEIMGYTREKWDWCVRNEQAIWGLMMDKKDLYKADRLVLTSYLNEGPFTSEISQEAPDRLGVWIGWRIAESYMEHHHEVSLSELIAESDAQKVLEQSYYKP